MRIINKAKKKAQRFNPLNDLLDDKTFHQYNEYLNNDDDLDREVLEKEEVPVVQIDEQNAGEYLADNYEGEEEIPFDESVDAPFEAPEIEGEDVPNFANVQVAMQWAIDNNRVVKIFYITSGRSRGGGGIRLKRELGLGGGARIHRIVEPHHMFQAKNGNLILVTYDRSVKHIRAFIVSNIVDYTFTDKNFKQRLRVMPNGKGIRAMKDIKTNLTKVAMGLGKKQLVKSAAIVRDSIVALERLKFAQYNGVQGYWLRNRRCWDNCYRHKRATQPDSSAQEVWMSCWEEYKKSIQDNESGWEKYAVEEDKGKLLVNAKIEEEWNKNFVDEVEQKAESGLTTAEAIYDTIDEQSKKYQDKVIEASSNLMTLAEALDRNGYRELGEEIVNLSTEMLKEAQVWEGIKNFGKGVKNWWSRNFGGLKSIINSLKTLNQLAMTILRDMNRNYQMTASEGRRIIVKAQNSPVPGVSPSPGGQGISTPTAIPVPQGNLESNSNSGIPQTVVPPAGSQMAALPRDFRLVYNTAQNTIAELSSLISMQPQNSPSLQYLDASVRNLQNFVDQYDTHINAGTLNEQTMRPLLQFLVKMTNQSMAGINSSMQQGVVPQARAVPQGGLPQAGVGFGPATQIEQKMGRTHSLLDLVGMGKEQLKEDIRALIDSGMVTRKQINALGAILFNAFRT